MISGPGPGLPCATRTKLDNCQARHADLLRYSAVVKPETAKVSGPLKAKHTRSDRALLDQGLASLGHAARVLAALRAARPTLGTCV